MAKQPDSSQSRLIPGKTPVSKPGSGFALPRKRPLTTVGLNSRIKSRSEPSRSAPQIDEEQGHAAVLSVTDRLHRNRKSVSSFLVSLIVHTFLIVVLAMIVFAKPDKDPVISVIAEVTESPKIEDSQFDIEKIEIVAPDEDESPLELKQEDLATDTELLAPLTDSSLIQVPNEFDNPAQADELAPVAPNQILPTGGGLEGRDAEARSRMAGALGGSKDSEQAVEDGIRWIVDHQQRDGSWRFIHNKGACKGRCQNPGSRESSTAATGLALMALLGAGYTHQVGPYQKEVQAGLEYLKSKMRVNTYGGNLAEGTMYAQAIATLALSEAYIMSGDRELQSTVELAMKYILSAQHRKGGWRYNPGEPGDMTVTGWQLMALKSCSMGGFEVPRETWEKARMFLDSKGESGGSYYGYMKPGIEAVPTAVGLLSQMYLGWPREHTSLSAGAERLADWGPSENNVYFNYYATQVLHHLRPPAWDDWNPQLRDYLVRTQDQRGHQAGSWYFQERHAKSGGRLYTTAMSVMILEVYYRYMPLYDERVVD